MKCPPWLVFSRNLSSQCIRFMRFVARSDSPFMMVVMMIVIGFESLQGENVPAPFMSFEAVGFPPDILREVLLLAQSFRLFI